MHQITNKEVDRLARCAAYSIRNRCHTIKTPILLYGIPRGGVAAAYAILSYLEDAEVVDSPDEASVIVDDLIDSGATRDMYKKRFPMTPFVVLINKQLVEYKNKWIVFPWEVNESGGTEDIPIRLLQAIGENPERGGLIETPKRFMRAWSHFTSGYNKDPASVLKVFEDGGEDCSEMVMVRDIPLYSQCEHHMVPFFGVAHIAYIPSGKIVGLSKLSRVLDIYARRLQVQERLTNQVADALNDNLNPLGVGVILQCRHLCMESRGVSQQGHITVSSAMRGALMDKPEARAEFLSLALSTNKSF